MFKVTVLILACIAWNSIAIADPPSSDNASKEKVKPAEPQIILDEATSYHITKFHEYLKQHKIDEAVAEHTKIVDLHREWQNKEEGADAPDDWLLRVFKAQLQELRIVQGIAKSKQQKYVSAFKNLCDARNLLIEESFGDAFKLASKGITELEDCFDGIEGSKKTITKCYLEKVLGSTCVATSNLKQARSHLDKAAKIGKELFGEEYHPELTRTFELQVMVLLAEQRYAEAEKLSREVLDRGRKSPLFYKRNDLKLRALLANALLGQKRMSEAESIAEHTLLLVFKKTPEQMEHPEFLFCQLLLAEICIDDGEFEAAKSCLDSVLEYYEAQDKLVYEKIRAYKVQAMLLEKTKKMDELEELNRKIKKLQAQLAID